MIFGFGKSSTRVMPSVASGRYSPGPGMAAPSVAWVPSHQITRESAQYKLLSQDQNPISLLQSLKVSPFYSDAAIAVTCPEEERSSCRLGFSTAPVQIHHVVARAARENWTEEAKTPEAKREREKSDFLRYCDRNGLYADFHSTRHLFVTSLERAAARPDRGDQRLAGPAIRRK